MEINWILIISYITVVIISNIIPLTTIVAGIIGIPVAITTKNSMVSQVFGYTISWSAIAWLWNYLNDRSFPLAIALIVLLILTWLSKNDSNLDANGRGMNNAERISLAIVSAASPFVFGFSWF